MSVERSHLRAFCLCLTYGRPHVLKEVIESVLRQDCAGEKELVVLNDVAKRQLTCNEPSVRIINVSARFRIMGEKQNGSAALASHDILFVWDDNDHYLRRRISHAVKKLRSLERAFYNAAPRVVLNDEELLGPGANVFHSGVRFTRELVDAAHGYRQVGSGQDRDLEAAASRLLPHEENHNQIPVGETYYLYLWGGTASYHASDFGRSKGLSEWNCPSRTLRSRRDGGGPGSDWNRNLRPRWNRDYLAVLAYRVPAEAATTNRFCP